MSMSCDRIVIDGERLRGGLAAVFQVKCTYLLVCFVLRGLHRHCARERHLCPLGQEVASESDVIRRGQGQVLVRKVKVRWGGDLYAEGAQDCGGRGLKRARIRTGAGARGERGRVDEIVLTEEQQTNACAEH